MKSIEYIGNVTRDVARESLRCDRVPLRESVHDFFGSIGKRERLAAVFSIVRKIIPDTVAKNLAEKLAPDYELDNLPFRFLEDDAREPVASGYVSEVFLLESRDESPSFVVKVDYMNRGSVNDLTVLAQEQRTEYKHIRTLYESLPGLVPEEWSMIVESPRTAKPAIAMVQEFLGTDLKDVFTDMSEEDLACLLSADPTLADAFRKFVAITASLENPEFLDFLGKRNLVIGNDGEKHRLYFLDPHFPRGWSDAQKKDLLGRIEYLKKVAHRVQGESNVQTIAAKDRKSVV